MFFSFTFACFQGRPALAQELPPPDFLDDEEADVDPTKDLLEEIEEDLKDLTETERKDGLSPEDEEEPPESGEDQTHQLKFEFVSRVQFIDKRKGPKGEPPSGEPYMEVEYQTEFEIPVVLNENRNREKADAEYDSQHWGSLARNEYFDCQLDITIPQIPVEIATKINTTKKENEEEPSSKQLAVKLDFGEGLKEDWFSLCTDISGDTLNTKGDTVEYNLKTLKMIDPPLSSLVVEDFDPTAKIKIDLSLPAKIVPDDEINNDLVFSGEGQITLEPL